MKKILFILSFLLFSVVNASEFEYVYSEWIDYYPENVYEIRIESQDRYRWFKMENDEVFETEEYYDFLEGYERIEDSKKTFYRVINNEYIILNEYGNLIKDTDECRKVFCARIYLEPFIPNESIDTDEPEKPNEGEIVNPETFDPLYYYYYSFFISFLILIIINIKKIYLVMSNCFKYLLK